MHVIDDNGETMSISHRLPPVHTPSQHVTGEGHLSLKEIVIVGNTAKQVIDSFVMNKNIYRYFNLYSIEFNLSLNLYEEFVL